MFTNKPFVHVDRIKANFFRIDNNALENVLFLKCARSVFCLQKIL